MARFVVKPRGTDNIIIKCFYCGTMYVPNTVTGTFVEKCPFCGYYNSLNNRIPLWKYNLIKWFRGGFREQTGHSSPDD